MFLQLNIASMLQFNKNVQAKSEIRYVSEFHFGKLFSWKCFKTFDIIFDCLWGITFSQSCQVTPGEKLIQVHFQLK